jgi:hypothetical protein
MLYFSLIIVLLIFICIIIIHSYYPIKKIMSLEHLGDMAPNDHIIWGNLHYNVGNANTNQDNILFPDLFFRRNNENVLNVCTDHTHVNDHAHTNTDQISSTTVSETTNAYTTTNPTV